MSNSNIQTFQSITKEQKQSISLLAAGTFLEYFDLMLYIHMAVLLNELFFPKTDPYTASLLSAFAFCSTYVLRPFGALIFGYMGDKYGRKTTVVFTTIGMSISCIIMANIPTYAQVGIIAAWAVTICRILQGLTTMGEVIGANIYITEITKPPVQYPAVTLMAIAGVTGGVAALGLATFVTAYGYSWRIAFWCGAIIAVVGTIARTKLRETKDFSDAKLRIERAVNNTQANLDILNKSKIWNEKINIKTALSLFFIECSWPACFYVAFIYCGDILKTSFGFSADQVIQQNFMLSIVQLLSWIILAYLSYKFYPIAILKVKLVIFSVFIVSLPFLLETADSPMHILLIQIFIVAFGFMGTPAVSIFYQHIPIFKRFRYVAFMYALSRAVIYIITSFGTVYFVHLFGHKGIMVILLPTLLIYTYGIYHFEFIDKKVNNGIN